MYSALPSGTITSGRGNGSLDYGPQVPWEGTLTASGGGGCLVTSTNVQGGQCTFKCPLRSSAGDRRRQQDPARGP